jgi:tetratricopeptide (TPR) repeat protein
LLRRFLPVGCFLFLLGPAAAQSPTLQLGHVVFPNSGKPEAQPPFLQGVAALHSFEYGEAVDFFRDAQRLDPAFALAYWGEAMAYNQPLWRAQDQSKGRLALLKLGPTREDRIAKAPTPRERAYLEAVETLYGRGDKDGRDRAYSEAMRAIYEASPADPEAATFYALSLLGMQPLDERVPELADRAAAILAPVFERHPTHPGAAHYLIHAYDDPAHAALGLPAARVYATIAPASSHALHMPAHIYLQLGMWDEAVASDEASFRASADRVARKGLSIGDRDYHSLSWLQYEYLQQGRYGKAKESFGPIQEAVERLGTQVLRNELASMRARYVIETRRWAAMKGQIEFVNVDELFAVGLSAAMMGDAVPSGAARDLLGKVAAAEQPGARQDLVRALELQLAGMTLVARKRPGDAIPILQKAADTELKMPAPIGRPHPIKPSHELLGEILLHVGRPAEAAKAFDVVLGRAPNRALALLGRARAAAQMKDPAVAREYYGRLGAIWKAADPDIDGLREIRASVHE